MKRKLSYAEACSTYPNEVADVVGQVRKSRSKHRGSDPSTWSWKYSVAVTIPCSHQLFALEEAELPAASIDDAVRDYVSRCSVHLVGGPASSTTCGYAQIAPPAFIAAEQREALERKAREREEFEALPIEEQEQQLHDTLKQLRRSPGFIAANAKIADALELIALEGCACDDDDYDDHNEYVCFPLMVERALRGKA